MGRSDASSHISLPFRGVIFTPLFLCNFYQKLYRFVIPGVWRCDGTGLQALPLTNFSSLPRNATPASLVVTSNKNKVTFTETVILTATGCPLGKISWRIGTVIEHGAAGASLPSITKTGPGLYEAICVGDPAVNQDWVAKRIDPIVDVVPIPNGPLYACPTETITLTATGAPDASARPTSLSVMAPTP